GAQQRATGGARGARGARAQSRHRDAGPSAADARPLLHAVELRRDGGCPARDRLMAAISPVAAPESSRLKRELGSFQFFTLAFGPVVGVGWAVVLGDWLRQAGPLGAILGLASGGVVILLIGLCYAEVATMLPVSGGEVAFAYEAFGQRACFLTGWLLAFTYI